MPAAINLFLRHLAFWLLQFLLFRICFLIWQGPWSENISVGHAVVSLFAGYRLDLSTIAYFFIVPFLLSILTAATGKKMAFQATRAYYLLLIPVTVILQTGSIAIHKFWGVLLNNRAVSFAADPAEVAASLTTIQFILIASLLIVLCTLNIITFNKLVMPASTFRPKKSLPALLWHLPLLGMIILMIRGGLQQIPVNESAAYYSHNTTLNHIAVNSLWHLGNSIRQSSESSGNPYEVLSEAKATALTDELTDKRSGITTHVFKETGKPNVVIIMLESWTADIIEPLGGLPGVTPFFSELCASGLLFTGIYSSGFRTDQGLTSVLSGFPAQPNKSIIRFPDKTQKLPSLGKTFQKAGYHTSFYYGGELGFANMKSYLLSAGFSHLTGKDDFPTDVMNSKWGAHDGVVLSRQASELDTTHQPFFSVLLTLSTHEPFEVPVNTPFNGKEEPELFKKSAWYTDLSLREYFNTISTKPWFKNTLFVLVADHGHRLPLNRKYEDPAIRHIPLLLWSPLLADSLRGKTIHNTGSQHDLPATLLEQLGLDHDTFSWSNDLLKQPRNNFAYQSLDESIIWITPSDTLHLKLGTSPPESMMDSSELKARAFLQRLYQEFIDL